MADVDSFLLPHSYLRTSLRSRQFVTDDRFLHEGQRRYHTIRASAGVSGWFTTVLDRLLANQILDNWTRRGQDWFAEDSIKSKLSVYSFPWEWLTS